MVKKLALVFGLLLSVSLLGAWDGSWDCIPSTNNPVFTGTVTADGFYVPPKTQEGGSTSWSECEGGPGCPLAGQGNTLTEKLPDGANPLLVNKSYSPGFQLKSMISQVSFGAYDGGGFCLPTQTTGLPTTCTNENASATTGFGFLNGVYVEECVVIFSDNTGWDSVGGVDRIDLQMVVVDPVADTKTDLGDSFTIVDPTTGCAGLSMTTNCADAEGVFEWQVNGVVSGASTVAQGYLAVEFDTESLDFDGDAVVRLSAQCKYF